MNPFKGMDYMWIELNLNKNQIIEILDTVYRSLFHLYLKKNSEYSHCEYLTSNSLKMQLFNRNFKKREIL